MRVESHPAYLLHRRKYRETSLILEFLSQEHGRVGCILRGVYAKNRRSKIPPDMFQGYQVAWIGKGELPVVTTIEASKKRCNLQDKRLYCGFYLNELIMRLTGRHDPNSELFSTYENTLEMLSSDLPMDAVLRYFEKRLLECCGYGLVLDHDVDTGEPIDPEKLYYYEMELGPVLVPRSESPRSISGKTLNQLAENELVEGEQGREAKLLMRRIIDFYIGGRPLASRTLFSEIK